jgi:uncharacterized protein with GYD domain
VVCLIFISLLRSKKSGSEAGIDQETKMLGSLKKKGIKILSYYWTLGRYDAVFIFEAPTEKDAMKLAIEFGEAVTVETMVAIPREEAIKLI